MFESHNVKDVHLEEWAIADDLGRIVGLPPVIRSSKEDIERYLEWLMEVREEKREDSITNEESGFQGGNEAWIRWNVNSGHGFNRDGGEKERTYHIIKRIVTPWVVG